jgi:hypothetical protein
MIREKTISLSDNSSICKLLSFPNSTKDGSFLVAIGNSNGYLEIIRADVVENEDEEDMSDEESDDKKPIQIEGSTIQLCTSTICYLKLFTTAISILSRYEELQPSIPNHQPHPLQGFLVTASFFDNTVCLLKSNAEGKYVPVLKLILPLQSQPIAVWWTSDGLSIGDYSGTIHGYSSESIINAVSATRSVEDTRSLDEVSFSYNWSIKSNQLVAGESIKQSNIHLAFCMEDNLLRLFRGSRNVSAVPNVETIDLNETCSDTVTTAAIAPNGKYFAAGAADGSMTVWGIDNTTTKLSDCLVFLLRVALHAEPVISLAFSSDSSQIITSAADGSIFICTVDRFKRLVYEFDSAKHSLRTKKYIRECTAENTVRTTNNATWFEDQKKQRTESLRLMLDSKNKELKECVNNLKDRLNDILESQRVAGELDKLAPDELVIDVSMKDEILKKNEIQVQELVNDCKLKIAKNELIAAKIWDETVGKMQEPLYIISQMGEVKSKAIKVESFPLCVITREEELQIKKVKLMRANELRTQLTLGTNERGLLNYDLDVNWIFGENLLDSDETKISTVEEETKKSIQDRRYSSHEEDYELKQRLNKISIHNLSSLLLRPKELRTTNQKRLQIILLTELAKEIRQKFNKQFQILRTTQEDIISTVKDRNARIREILKDLGSSESLEVTDDYPHTVDTSVIVIDPTEMVAKPFQKKSSQSNLNDNDDDISSATNRALQDMMRGTLQMKRNFQEESISLQQPAWVNTTPVSDMTEAQIAEYNLFIEKRKTLEENQQIYRRQLDIELKKGANQFI